MDLVFHHMEAKIGKEVLTSVSELVKIDQNHDYSKTYKN